MVDVSKIEQKAISQLGSPYVFGARGEKCTPSIREKYLKLNPTKTTIKTKCQILNGSKTTCDGCPFNGKKCFDCRGFTYWVLKQFGITLEGAGATSQWNGKTNWEWKGTVTEMDKSLFYCLFKYKESTGKMEHTGFWLPSQQKIIDCSNGVEYHNLSSSWTHAAIPKGIYSEEEVEVIMSGLAKITANSGKTVNVRSGPSKNANITKTLPIGTTVEVLESDGKWSKVRYSLEGYVMNDFLKMEEEPAK